MIDKTTKMNAWKNYIKELFDDNKPTNPPQLNVDDGMSITQKEVRAAITKMKDGKVHGPYGIHEEFFKVLDDENIEK